MQYEDKHHCYVHSVNCLWSMKTIKVTVNLVVRLHFSYRTDKRKSDVEHQHLFLNADFSKYIKTYIIC